MFCKFSGLYCLFILFEIQHFVSSLIVLLFFLSLVVMAGALSLQEEDTKRKERIEASGLYFSIPPDKVSKCVSPRLSSELKQNTIAAASQA